MKNFLVIDGNSIMNRAFYGLANSKMYSNTAGIHTNAIYAFLNTYWMIIDKVNPDYIAVSFDLKGPTFRHKMYTEYKGTRKGMPEELAEQMPVIKEVLTAMNVPILELEGYEADDILGTVAADNSKHDIFTYILTGDKDSFQLISDSTTIVMPKTKMGKTEYTFYTKELLKETLDIEPYQVVEIKSLMGDSSDNIPGVKGIGEKTAYNLIGKYTTLQNIYDNIDTLDASSRIKEKLTQEKEIAFLSKELATIDLNVPVEINYEDCKFTDVNKEELYKLFKKLEFNKFLNKYDFSQIDTENVLTEGSSKHSELAAKISKVAELTIIDSNNVSEYMNIIDEVLSEEKISYILSEVKSEQFTCAIGLDLKHILAIYSNVKNKIYVIDLQDIQENMKDEYVKILSNFAMSKALKLGYNIKQDMLFLFNNISKTVNNFKYDVMIAYHLLDSNRSNYPIEYILNDIFDITLDIQVVNTKKQIQLSLFEDETEEKLLKDEDIKNITCYLKGIYESYDIVMSKLKENEMTDLFETIEMPLAETLASMEHEGMYIDREKLREFDREISQTLDILETEIHELAGEIFNINSPQQLGTILFDKLALPVIKKGKTGYSTDKTVLEKLYDEHPIIEKILEYRQINKLKTTYVDGLEGKIGDDGRVHTTFMQTVTSTGRLSSVEPNLQNIPIRLELGRKIRSFFVGENNNIIIDADYSQIELRVLAHISNDETMIDAFKNEIDIHKVTASQVFDVALEDVTSEMRSKAKAVNFGIVYGISEFGLAKNISVSRKEAGVYIKNYLEKYHGIRQFMEDIVKEAKEKGYVDTLFKRRRYIPELKQKNKNIIQFGERIAMNTPIQGTAADIIKLAMNKIYYSLKENNLKSRLIMQVHDELIIEAIPEEEEKIKEIMYNAMEHIIKLNVPLSIDLNIGKSWYDAK